LFPCTTSADCPFPYTACLYATELCDAGPGWHCAKTCTHA
jgi:hypothetical protein